MPTRAAPQPVELYVYVKPPLEPVEVYKVEVPLSAGTVTMTEAIDKAFAALREKVREVLNA